MGRILTLTLFISTALIDAARDRVNEEKKYISYGNFRKVGQSQFPSFGGNCFFPHTFRPHILRKKCCPIFTIFLSWRREGGQNIYANFLIFDFFVQLTRSLRGKDEAKQMFDAMENLMSGGSSFDESLYGEMVDCMAEYDIELLREGVRKNYFNCLW